MRKVLRRRTPFVPGSLAILVASLIAGAGTRTALAQERTALQIGQGAKCQKCHKAIVADFPADLHGRSVKFLSGAESATCDSCHGDGTKHIKSADPKDIHLTKEDETQACLSCHGKEQTRHSWKGSPHDREDMNCNSCHSTHHPKSPSRMLAKSNEIELCISCHKDQQKALYQRSSHLLRTEHQTVKVGCVSCHNPHGGEGRRMLAASSTTQLCWKCHAEKRGPFLWEHAPVREDCFSCHVPHGSNNPSMLRVRNHMLCQQCHMNMLWRHQTVAGFDMFTFNRGCLNCHGSIHGSNHPSGKGLTR